MNAVDLYGDTPLHNALRHHTMTQLKELKQTSQDVAKVMTSSQKKLSLSIVKISSSIVIYLASQGADFTILNTSGQSPLDLCSDPALLKILEKCQVQEQHIQNGVQTEKPDFNACVLCRTAQRNILFIPCGHMTVCQQCDSSVTRCSLCEAEVNEKIKIEECIVCSDVQADVLFKPCLHMVACDSCAVVMKKCVHCRVAIETCTPRIVCCGGKPPKRRSGSRAGLLNPTNEDVTVLQQQLQDLREKILCVVCMDRRRNCIFLCGHGTCQPCADKLTECPICRKTLEKKIILFD